MKKVYPETSVFINCPFDAAYAPLFEAIIFATVSCGFTPRSAIESESVTEPRMERIVGALFDSRYSIHDLSRSRGEGEEGLARFNMALELGIAIARRYMTRDSEQQHDWFLLVPPGYEYHRFLSDLSGYDPAHHDGTIETLVPQVVLWLADLPNPIPAPSPSKVIRALPRFQLRMRRLRAEWGGRTSWKQVLDAARESAPKG